MFMRQFTVVSKGNVEGSYRNYLLADNTGLVLSVYRCDWGKWPEFKQGDEVAVMQLKDRLAWEAAGFDQDRVTELPERMQFESEIRNTSNACSA